MILCEKIFGMPGIIDVALHLSVPAVVARYGFQHHRFRVWLILSAAMIIDLDHLLADPIYDPNRCGVGFHPLHSYPAVILYVTMLWMPEVRIAAIGLLIHIGVDLTGCVRIALSG